MGLENALKYVLVSLDFAAILPQKRFSRPTQQKNGLTKSGSFSSNSRYYYDYDDDELGLGLGLVPVLTPSLGSPPVVSGLEFLVVALTVAFLIS